MKSKPIVDHLENVTMELFGRSRVLSIAGNSCMVCGKPATDFKDEISRKEFSITGMCQLCQDDFFKENDDE